MQFRAATKLMSDIQDLAARAAATSSIHELDDIASRSRPRKGHGRGPTKSKRQLKPRTESAT